MKLGEETDEDGTVELAVGSNVVSVEVTAEDGETTRTYTVTVNRADPVVPFTDATLSSLELSDVPFTFDSDTTSYEVPTRRPRRGADYGDGDRQQRGGQLRVEAGRGNR